MERTHGPTRKKFNIETATREELITKIENQGKTLTALHNAKERDIQQNIDDYTAHYNLKVGLRQLLRQHRVPQEPVLPDPAPDMVRDHLC